MVIQIPTSETITFFDEENDQFATIIVRVAGSTVGLCLSLEQEGDIEVFLPATEMERFLCAVQKVVETTKVS